MTLRQPTDRHGGNARIDEEITMIVSKKAASLDAWLVRAEEVLEEQREQSLSPSSSGTWENTIHEWQVSLTSFEKGIGVLLERLCGRPGRWVLIAEDAEDTHLYWQALAFEDGSLVVEASNYTDPKDADRVSTNAAGKLIELGWDEPDLPSSPNWRRVEATTTPDIADVALQAARTLREVFQIDDEDELLLRLFPSARRGMTPASECVDDASPGLDEAAPRRGFQPTDEEWADYYLQLYPEYKSPRNSFDVWKYATTAVDAASEFWSARERARATWVAEHGDDASTWPVSHPPVVLWIPDIAKAACLACTWIDPYGKSDPSVSAGLARQHAIEQGATVGVVQGLSIPVSARNGPADGPLEQA